MDTNRCDLLVRALTAAGTRRAMLAGAAAALAAALGNVANGVTKRRKRRPDRGPRDTSDRLGAEGKKKKKKKKNKPRPGKPDPCTGVVCDPAPNAAVACVGGDCVITACDAGFRDCDGNVANGCETSIQDDPRNCGRCGHVCPGSGPDLCDAGECTLEWRNQTTFGSFGSGPNELHAPWSLFVTDDALTVFIAEVQNSRISVWSRPDADSTDWSN